MRVNPFCKHLPLHAEHALKVRSIIKKKHLEDINNNSTMQIDLFGRVRFKQQASLTTNLQKLCRLTQFNDTYTQATHILTTSDHFAKAGVSEKSPK